MIQGDIDLTEQLDFYRNKPKKIEKGTSIVPWKGRDQKDLVTTINGRSYDSWVYHNAFTFSLNPTTTVINSSYTTYTTDNLMYYYDIDNSTWNGNISTTVHYNITPQTVISSSNLIPVASDDDLAEDEHVIDSGNSTDIIIEDISENHDTVISTYNTWYSYNDPYTVTLEYVKPEPVDPIKARFYRGNNRKEKVVGKECCFCGKRTIGTCECYKTGIYNDQYEMRKRFTTKKVRNRKVDNIHYQNALKYRFSENIRFLLFGTRAITKKNERYLDPRHTMKNRYRRIPWLDKLIGRVYEDYMKDLYEEQDYSSYLTNMGWLRIHETILIDNTDTITIS